MDLIQYLNQNFYTREQLLDLSKVDSKVFQELQSKGIMPQCSYRLTSQLCCDSFFGEHTESYSTEYYAKGYTSWLGILVTLRNTDDAYSIFKERYELKISSLFQAGFLSQNSKVNSELNSHIKEEWKHFIDGVYGLCTKSGLPEDIASKELSILIINQLLESEKLTDKELKQLTDAVNLLDSASSMFAPHERIKSSRRRLVDDVRRRFKL
ncbi:DUF6058 family natural product biosynthesis protein [Aliikangiella coralliicola]|uniref:Orphan protein n=1 Tax=Aliikangiella coralliicola TaxID=2592383 RepID=A0A545TWD9_9GAMM|nr:DUF6058 family natural product biosynthesis protein [Aliikangiella coralliicola]TQV81536.1 hypothetical protein FLL46_25645 [Aliikangiella coralliicola]